MSDGDMLPAGWALAPLSDLLWRIEAGKSFKCEERPPAADEVGVVKVSAVTWGEYQEQESKTCTDASRISSDLYIRAGDFLFSRANTIELVGACVIARRVTQHVMLSDKILRFHFVAEDMKEWVLQFLRSKQGREQIKQLASGNQDSMRNIGQERIGQVMVPLPPNAERTEIVARLDELLSELAAGTDELIAAKRKLAAYRQSLLKAAVEGDLTAEWRARNPQQETSAELLARILRERRARWEAEELRRFAANNVTPPKAWQSKYREATGSAGDELPPLPGGWTWASVEQIGDVQLGRQRSPDKVGGESPTKYIRAANITESGVTLDDVLEMDFSETEIRTFALQAGDVLLTEASGSAEHVGRPALWPGGAEVYCFQNTVLRFTSHAVSPSFALYLFRAQQKLGVFRRLSGGVGINHLSAGKFAGLTVPVPPRQEQAEIAQRLEEHFSGLDEQAGSIAMLLKMAAAQRQNILRAAFTGQLVPQDPNDEPASVLLARIRAQRSTAASAGTARSRAGKLKARAVS